MKLPSKENVFIGCMVLFVGIPSGLAWAGMMLSLLKVMGIIDYTPLVIW